MFAEEEDSAISTKEIISSIVNAATKKLNSRHQAEKSGDNSSSYSPVQPLTAYGKNAISIDNVSPGLPAYLGSYDERSIDEAVYRASQNRTNSQSLNRSNCSSREILSDVHPAHGHQSISAPIASSDTDLEDFEYADASSPSSASFSRQFSPDSFSDRHDEVELSHSSGGLPSSTSQDTINTLRRIENDVSTLLQVRNVRTIFTSTEWGIILNNCTCEVGFTLF